MPEITVNIGGRRFVVACQEGEEAFLHSAAELLNEEAVVLVEQIGQLTESRLLLMSGLLLADKTAALKEQLVRANSELAAAKSQTGSADVNLDGIAELAARAERIASSAS